MRCGQCGREYGEGARFCTHCAAPVGENKVPQTRGKRIALGIVAIFLGMFGVHNFLMGNRTKGMTQLLVSTVGGILSCGISSIVMELWAIIEAVQLISGKWYEVKDE